MTARLLYVSSATRPAHDKLGYTLAGGCELATLVQEILTAMARGTMIMFMSKES